MSAAAAKLAPKTDPLWSPPPEFKRVPEKGFTQFPNAYLVHLGRICSGSAEQLCVLFIARHTFSAARDAGQAAPDRSKPLSTEDFTWFLFESARQAPITVKQHLANVRLVEHSLKRLSEDKVIDRKAGPKRGTWTYRIQIEKWEQLPDYVQKKPAASAESLDSADEEPEEEDRAAPHWQGRWVSNGAKQDAVDLTYRPDRIRPPRCKNGEIEVKARVSRNGTLEQEVRILSFSEEKEKVQRNGFRQESVSVENTGPHIPYSSGWNGFFLAVADSKLSFSRVDLQEAERIFNRLSLEDQILATQGLRDRLKAGEFNDPRFRPRPDTYLAKRAWERPIRPQKAESGNLFDRAMKKAQDAQDRMDGKDQAAQPGMPQTEFAQQPPEQKRAGQV